LEIHSGEFIAIMGPSGSGKSTLLNLMGCLDVPNDGEIWIDGNSTGTMTDNQLTDLRLNTIGFVFQYFNLFPLFNALKNVHYPYVTRTGRVHDTIRAEEALTDVGLPDNFWHHRPNQLSGGQQQRVAIARALVNDPAIILCDEPTGNLDTKTGTAILELLSDLSTREGRTIVMVTHDLKTAGYADRIIRIVDGKVEGQSQ
jgi:putative ABC transport system ATP-binding protein